MIRCFEFYIFDYSSFPQACPRLWPAGLCIWTVPPGGVHMDLHVSVCVGDTLYAIPSMVKEPDRL